MKKIKCPECSKLLEESLTTCSYCGYPFCGSEERKEVKKCPECGNDVENELEQCDFCAYPLKDDSIEMKIKKAEEEAALAEQRAVELEKKLKQEEKNMEAERRLAEANKKLKEANKKIEEVNEKARKLENRKAVGDKLQDVKNKAQSTVGVIKKRISSEVNIVNEEELESSNSQMDKSIIENSGVDDLSNKQSNDWNGIQTQQEGVASITGERKNRFGKDELKKIISFSALMVVLVSVICIILINNGSRGSSEELAVIANINADGTAFFSTKNGVISFKGDAQSGMSTPDQKQFIVLDRDGSLYYYSSAKAEKERIAYNVRAIEDVKEKGCVFTDQNGQNVEAVLQILVDDYDDYITYATAKKAFEQEYSNRTVNNAKNFYKQIMGKQFPEYKLSGKCCIYNFYSKRIIELGATEFIVANNCLTTAGITKAGQLVVFKEGYIKAENVCDIGVDSELLAVSEDGNTVIWNKTDGINSTIYSYDNGEKNELGNLGEIPKYGYIEAQFFNDGKNVVVSGSDYENVIIGNKDEVNVVKLNSPKNYNEIIDTEGRFLEASSITSKGIYLTTDTEVYNSNLYYVDLLGNKEKVLSNIVEFVGIHNGKIYYIDEDENLYAADLEVHAIKNEEKISSEVESAELTFDGKYLYLEREETMYYVDLSNDDYETIKITENVYINYMTTQSDTIYYIKDAQEIEGSYYEFGELYKYTVGKGEDKITSDVVELKYTTLYPTLIDKESPAILKYSDVNEDDIVYELGEIVDNKYKKISDEVVD